MRTHIHVFIFFIHIYSFLDSYASEEIIKFCAIILKNEE